MLKIFTEISGHNFDFFGGARDTAKYLTYDELDNIFYQLREIYPDGVSEITINELFWFDEDLIAEMLGYDNFDELMEDRKND